LAENVQEMRAPLFYLVQSDGSEGTHLLKEKAD
jgi:hypothetical protein